MPTQKLTNEMIAAAIEGFEAQKRRIDSHIAELRGMLGRPELRSVHKYQIKAR